MTDTREKAISYQRAEYFNEDPKSRNVGSGSKQAMDKLKTVHERTMARPWRCRYTAKNTGRHRRAG